MFSVLILTLNEEANLPNALASANGCDDLVVLDSGSTDRTAEIARDAGARFFTHPFSSFAEQRNHAQTELTFRNPWVFHLDADEMLTPELFEECRRWIDADTFDGAYVAPRMLFRGKWLPRCTDFPAYQARFVHAKRFRWIEVGHGQREHPAMRMATLKNNYLHEMFASGEDEWLAKHRRYARKEALRHAQQPSHWRQDLRDALAASGLKRRRALKALSYHLPLRPALRFLYQFGFRRGFLDGQHAWTYCRLLARYERFADNERHRVLDSEFRS